MDNNPFVSDILENDTIYTEAEPTSKYVLNIYENLEKSELKKFIQITHEKLMMLLKHLKECTSNNKYFHAEESRKLIRMKKIIQDFEEAQEIYKVKPEVREILEKIDFLKSSGGSTIPENFICTLPDKYNKIIMDKSIPSEVTGGYEVKKGESGSYGNTYVIKDKLTKKKYVLKELQEGCNEKDIKRFEVEKKALDKLSSPYIVKKYSMTRKLFKNHRTQHSYLMEYCDCTLYEYINKNNSLLSDASRKRLVRQLLEAVRYIHEKKMLHRDLSYANVFIKKYDHVVIVKIADFGLVKTEESILTSIDTDVKGSLIDPTIGHDGVKYKDYSEVNEIYSVGKLMKFILTGKSKTNITENSKYFNLIEKCTTLELNKRFKNINEIIAELNNIK